MRLIAIGVQETHGDRLYALRRQSSHGSAELRLVKRLQNAAVAVHAFGDLDPVPSWHERIGELQKQVVNIVPLLGAHL